MYRSNINNSHIHWFRSPTICYVHQTKDIKKYNSENIVRYLFKLFIKRGKSYLKPIPLIMDFNYRITINKLVHGELWFGKRFQESYFC